MQDARWLKASEEIFAIRVGQLERAEVWLRAGEKRLADRVEALEGALSGLEKGGR